MRVEKFTVHDDVEEALLDDNSGPMFIGENCLFEGGLPIYITNTTTLTGALEGQLVHPDDDKAVVLADGSATWEPLVGGDLADVADGGILGMYTPVNYIRVRIDTGSCNARVMF